MPPDFDPHKTLRDLQSALERESDLREQLKFAEEEAGTLRQKVKFTRFLFIKIQLINKISSSWSWRY